MDLRILVAQIRNRKPRSATFGAFGLPSCMDYLLCFLPTGIRAYITLVYNIQIKKADLLPNSIIFLQFQ